jgi:phosphatidylserine/phosphatidylglycerophosphate/cardiolipin synthase-like enzyme
MIEALRRLPGGELRRLAGAVRSGRLTSPYTGLALRQLIGAHRADEVAEALAALDADGMVPRHVALVLDVIADAAVSPGSPVTLVASGPEVPGIPMRDTGAVVRELFGAARESVLVVGYAVYQGRDVFRVLAERMDTNPELKVRMCLDVSRPPGDTSHASEILGRFAYRFRTAEWPGTRLPEVLYDPRALTPEREQRASLHAKCVVVDSVRAFVSSANFTEAGQERNVEVGVLLTDPSIGGELGTYFEALVEGKRLLSIPGLGTR